MILSDKPVVFNDGCFDAGMDQREYHSDNYLCVEYRKRLFSIASSNRGSTESEVSRKGLGIHRLDSVRWRPIGVRTYYFHLRFTQCVKRHLQLMS